MSKYFVTYREDYDDQTDEFDSDEDVVRFVKRIKALEDEEDGEAGIHSIIKGEDVTNYFLNKVGYK